MTPEQQRIAIAEACGWKIHRTSMKGPKDGITLIQIVKPEGVFAHPYPCREGTGVYGYLPDYVNDLNAMHEAEKVLGKMGSAQWNNYIGTLLIVCGIKESQNVNCAIMATAAQRAEAFLRAVGKWTYVGPE